MRATRLVSLLLLLQTRGRLTATELAARLDVSVRTVQRDVESLAAAGVPVEAVRGPAGGYRLAGGYRTRLTGLNVDEAEALFVGGPAAELGLGGELAAARLKVLAAMPSELQERATRASRLFHLDTRGWFRAGDRVPHLPTLASALWAGTRVRMRYREGPRTVQRTVDPLGLVLKGGAWYLVAQRTAGMRVYRVSRVASARALEEPAERPADFDLAAYWKESTAQFRERPRYGAVVRLEPKTAEMVKMWGCFSRVASDQHANPDGWVTMRAQFEDEDHACFVVLGLGPRAEVLEPANLRERVTADINQMLKRR